MRTVAFILFLAIISSCKQEKKIAEGPSQMEEVMAIHDEVMPKMGTLSKLVAELKEKVDSTDTGKEYEMAMKDLQEANKSMMDWMMGFGNRFDSDEILEGKELSPEKQVWLNEEEEKVKEVAKKINTSIAKAEVLIKE
ncbi:hypothetical protein [uncultured Croceitalea sp.]|uniref:hypothetical protein n=1 Tax=uncultured Croceitalea sp. TaxID=1798908 RepID=UPI003305E22F